MNLERQSARAETPGAGDPDSFGGSPRSGTTSGCRSEVGFKPTKTTLTKPHQGAEGGGGTYPSSPSCCPESA